MFLCIIDLRVGLHKGHPTTAIEKQVKPSHRKGVSSTRTKFVRSIIREVAGFTPYERRVMELLRNSKVRLQRPIVFVSCRSVYAYIYRSQDKKARKLTKKRVRRHSRICKYHGISLLCDVYSSGRSCARSASWRSWAPLSRSTEGQVTKSSASVHHSLSYFIGSMDCTHMSHTCIFFPMSICRHKTRLVTGPKECTRT